MPSQASFFHIPKPIAQPRVKLFCFPHAGGSASMFHKWPRLLDPDVEVLALMYPGRGNRLREQPHRHMAHLVSALLEAVRSRLDTPYAFFGHSLGALVGYELIRALRRDGARLPSQFFVSAHRAPQMRRVTSPIHSLPQSAFLTALEERYGSADQALREPELADLMFPSIQADFEILETYTYEPEKPLPVPITAFLPRNDQSVRPEGIEAWREQTSQRFTLHTLDGDHFYLMSDSAPLLRIVSDALKTCDATPP